MLFVSNSAPNDLVRKWRNITLAKKQKTEEIANRIALGPLEVGMGIVAGCLLQMDEHRSNSIRHYWTSST